MHIKSIRLQNYRCFRDSGELPLQKFAVLIGRNDSGKSSLLSALRVALSGKGTFSDQDHWIDPEEITDEHPDGIRAETLAIFLRFYDSGGNELHLRVQHQIGDIRNRRDAEALCVGDETLDADLSNFSLEDLRSICNDYSIPVFGNRTRKQSYVTAMEDYISDLPRTPGWKPLTSVQEQLLPMVRHYQSSDDINPEAVIKHNLQEFFKSSLLVEHLEQLASIREEVEATLNAQARELEPALQEHSPSVQHIRVEIDANSFSQLTINQVQIIQRDGRPIDWARIGAGKKREMSLGIFRWQQNLLKKQLSDDGNSGSNLVVLFDEPDVNLDYQAQRIVTILLQELAGFMQCQVIVATHSVNLMDAVPASNITFFDTPPSPIWRFQEGEGEAEGLERIRLALDLRNSALFNERLMLVCEGDTDQNVFDVLYREVTSHTLHLSGVYLIAGHNNDQALQLAKIFKKNNRPVVLVLDQDCRTVPALRLSTDDEAHHSHGLIVNQDLFFVGTTEMEDLFEDTDWCEVLNELHPKLDGTLWTCEQIAEIRRSGKFSGALSKNVERHSGGSISKPELGRAVAQKAVERDRIPHALCSLIEDIRRIAMA